MDFCCSVCNSQCGMSYEPVINFAKEILPTKFHHKIDKINTSWMINHTLFYTKHGTIQLGLAKSSGRFILVEPMTPKLRNIVNMNMI